MNTEGKQSVFISWSGGKDCSLACYLALQRGMEACFLVSAIDHTGRLGAHALPPFVLKMQAQAIGIPLITVPVTVPTYDDDFRQQLRYLKQKGITGAVFGDVNLGNGEAKLHRQWIDSVCEPVGMSSYTPLWRLSRESVLRKLVDLEFDFRFVVVDNTHFSSEWLGKRINHEVIDELKRRVEESPSGKVGYYHTIVLDGPIFRKRVIIDRAKSIHRFDEWGDNWYWDIETCHPEYKPTNHVKCRTGLESCENSAHCA